MNKKACKYPGCKTLLSSWQHGDYCCLHENEEGIESAKKKPQENTAEGDPHNDPLLTIAQLKKELPYSERRIREYLKQGVIKGARLQKGGKWLVAKSEVERFKNQGGVIPETRPQEKKEEFGPRQQDHTELSSEVQVRLDDHLKSVRGLVERLRGELHLGSLEELYVEDIGTNGIHSKKSGKESPASLLIWDVIKDKEIRLLCSAEADGGLKLLMEDLKSHLANSEFSGILEKWERRRKIGGDILKLLNKLVSLIKHDIEEMTGFRIEEPIDEHNCRMLKPFPLSVCMGAVSMIGNLEPSPDSSYRRQDLSEVFCALEAFSYYIGIFLESKLAYYEELHKELSIRYSKHSVTMRIVELWKEINKLENDISKGFTRFSREIALPGYCEVCRKVFRQK